MRFASLGSGSKGNSALIECGATRVMVDCGFFLRNVENRLRAFDVDPSTIDAILVTHEHHDHICGVSRLARKYQIPVWLTAGTYSVWDDPVVPKFTCFNPHEAFTIGDLRIQPFPVPHDAREPAHYVFEGGGQKIGVLSDAGSVTPFMRDQLTRCDALMLEFNYDPAMLAVGPYPPSIRAHVGGDYGHLSNGQAAQLLRDIDITRLQHLALTHISQKNNTPELALAAARQALGGSPEWLVCAHQADGLAWRSVA